MYQAGGMKQPKRPLRWAMAGFLLLTAFCAGFVKSIALQQGIVLGAIPFVIGGLVPAAVLWGIGLGIGRLIRLLPKGSPAAARPPRDPKKPLQLARPPRWVLAGFVGAIVGLVAGFFGEDGGVFVEWVGTPLELLDGDFTYWASQISPLIWAFMGFAIFAIALVLIDRKSPTPDAQPPQK